MPTSGITAFEMTARDLVQAALEDNGIVRLGKSPTAAEMEACITRLNLMLKSWSLKVNLWRETSATYTVIGATGSYALPAGVQDVAQVRHVVSATHRRQLFRWERDDYRMLPNRASAGNPSAYSVERTTSALTLKLWPVPAANITVEVDYIRAAEVVTNETQTVDFRGEFQEAVFANLAVRCAGLFGQQAPDELIARAARLEREMFDYDRPDSYYLLAADC